MAEEKIVAAEEAVEEKKAPAKKAAAKPAAEKKPAAKKAPAKKADGKRQKKKKAPARLPERDAEAPAKKAPAKKAPAKAEGSLTIKLVKSLIGRSEKQIATAKALGLKKAGDVTTQPATHGKINRISHMVEVTKA